ncbi:hypothetical protein NP233_g5197 [Leucocoprinus birnbaumii]|uniref:Autophagy-related protein 27 n=1 Tax=Leucocoprinus birnbaumii TaxID=56174 RepID=A0AAD5VTA9_9AGAR|nr:hypothetical protein NP233_g5197 [Leucocoprinus birnbaumii]
MYSPPLLTLIITILGVSSTSTASPTIALSPSFSAPSTSKGTYNPKKYTHHDSMPHSTNNGDLIDFLNNDLEAGCNFVAEGRAYNICPLLHREKVVKIDSTLSPEESFKGKGKEKVVEREIKIILGGRRRTIPLESSSCSEGEQTCLIEWEGSQLRITSIGKEESPSVFVEKFTNEGRNFDLWLKSRQRTIRIAFNCDDDETIEYQVTSQGMRILRWRTPHACPLDNRELVSITEEQGEDPSPDDSDGSGLQGDMPVGGFSRGWLSLMVVLIVIMLITTTIVISSPQARHYILAHIQSAGYAILPLVQNLKQVTRPVAKHFPRFKVGESRLVRWAQEDMALDGDEDFMVNGSTAESHGWGDLEVMDEYVPLKSSTSFHKKTPGSPSAHAVSATWSYSTYGSVPFEGLDVDESEVDLPPKPESGMKRFLRSASETASLKVKGLFRG